MNIKIKTTATTVIKNDALVKEILPRCTGKGNIQELRTFGILLFGEV